MACVGSRRFSLWVSIPRGLGRQGDRAIDIDEWATLKGTHAYEVLCAIGSRVRRTYAG